MTYYKFNGKDDLWLGKYANRGGRRNWADRTLIPNELLTQREFDSMTKELTRLPVDRLFIKIDIPSNKTFTNFGVRFEAGNDYQGESYRRSARARRNRIRESNRRFGNRELNEYRKPTYDNKIYVLIDSNGNEIIDVYGDERTAKIFADSFTRNKHYDAIDCYEFDYDDYNESTNIWRDFDDLGTYMWTVGSYAYVESKNRRRFRR
jgi:hypothetical protein